jgi:hypothetical protein
MSNESGSIQNVFSSYTALQGVCVNEQKTYTATATLLPSDLCNTVIVGTLAANAVLTFPPVASARGKKFSVLHIATGGGTCALTFPANTVRGLITSLGNSDDAKYCKPGKCDGATTITYENTRNIGDSLNFYCDGVTYFVSGIGTNDLAEANARITIA